MTLEQGLTALQTLALILTMAVSISAIKGRGDEKTVALTTMQVDIKYIKEKVDGFEVIREVSTKAKASADSAHKRLDDHLRYDHNKPAPRGEG